MKKITCTFLVSCIAIVFLSSPVFADLYSGTWNDYSGGTWSETLAGNFPSFLGSVGQMQSNTLVWNCSNVTRTGVISDTGIIPDSGDTGYHETMTLTDTGSFGFYFTDSKYYTVTNMNGTVQFTMHFITNSPYSYNGADNIVWTGEGIIDQNHNFKIDITADGYETYNTYPTSLVHGGIVDFASATISAVPIPGAIWLLGSGLLGLLGIRRKLS